MGLFTWVAIIFAIAAILVTREIANEISIAHLYGLVIGCVLGFVLSWRSIIFSWCWRWCFSSDSRQASGCWRSKVRTRQINESLYELEEPEPPVTPNMVILFFHGFHSMDSLDMHLETWESADGSCIWPNEWLTKEFPGARILYVSYSAILGQSSLGNFDMEMLGENLVGDFLEANIGQTPNCPVILVGHCFGGLVIKQFCLHISKNNNLTRIESQRIRLETFLGRVKGIFYYGTPHKGSPCIDKVTHLRDTALLKYFKVLNKEANRLNSDFSHLCSVHASWRIQGLGESMPTERGLFRGVVAPEACSRDGDEFYVVPTDHVSISKPQSETDRRFYALRRLLRNVVDSMEVEVLGHQCQGLPDYAVELEKHAKEVEEKLKDVGVLGICGMGGIGKTTLAKYVYNYISKDFEYTCFVENVKGIQTPLDESILNSFYRSGRKVETTQWSALKEKQSLIVMDDIDLENQLVVLPKLQHFKNGSKIIITTRDKDVLRVYKSHGTYDVDFLKVDAGRKLFCQHAFGVEDIPDDMMRINHLKRNVTRVVDKCGGLPLTLEVMGRFLRDHEGNSKVWEETIDKLGKAQAIRGDRNDRVWASLKVSYDALVEEDQEMFIEAGAFFFRKPLDRALAAWSTKIPNSETRWANLVSRSMVKEVHKQKLVFKRMELSQYFLGDDKKVDYKEVWVHEQLRDLAKSLTKEEIKLGSEKLVTRLNANKLKEETKALRLHSTSTRIQLHSLAKLEKLRYLEVYRCYHERSGKNFPRKLSIMSWENQLSTRPLFPITVDQWRDLTILELKHLHIPERSLEALGSLTNLRILSLVRLTGLRTLPENFGKLSALEHLTLSGVNCLDLPASFGDLYSLVTVEIQDCSELASLPLSFGHNLKSLKYLKIYDCPLLDHLPKSFSQLPVLQVFSLNNCNRMRDLGDSFGNLPTLQCLYLSLPSIQQLPANFGLLSTLQELVLQGIGLTVLPDDINQLTALTILQIYADNLEMLPDSLGLLSSLQQLTIRDCHRLERLPENLGLLSSLQKLHISCHKLKRLPKNLGLLSSLQQLTIRDCHRLERLPENLGLLSSLQKLHISCHKLKRLPKNLGLLSSLQELWIDCDKLERLLENLGLLSSLQDLWIDCDKLERLPKNLGLLSSLQKLRIYCCNLERLPENLCLLSSLQKLHIGCHKLERLPENLGLLSSLQELTIRHCNNLERLPEDLGLLSSLQELWIDCDKLERLPENLGLLSSLQKLEIRCDKLERLPENLGLRSSLQKLEIWSDKLERLPENLGFFSSLQELKIKCNKLEMLPENLGELTRVKTLSLGVGSVILGKLSSELKELSIFARSLKILPSSVEQLSSLRHLDICYDDMEQLPDQLGELSLLEELKIKAKSLKNLPESIGQFQSLRKLIVADCNCLEDLPNQLGELSLLKELEISAKSLKNLPESIGQLQSLRKLTLAAGSLRSLPKSVGQLSSLQNVVLLCDECERLPDYFDHLPLSSIALELRGNNTILPEGLCNLSTLGDLSLELRDLEKIPEELGKLSSLRSLHIMSHKLECLPDSLGSISTLKEVRLCCPVLDTLPDSLGRPSSCPVILPQGEKRTEPMKLVERPSSQPTDAKGLRLSIGLFCKRLDEPVLRSLGWVWDAASEEWNRWYRRVIEC